MISSTGARLTGARILALTLASLALGVPGAHAASLDLTEMTIPQLTQAVTSGRVSCEAVIRGELDRIAKFDDDGPALNATVSVNPDALADAAALDARRRAGAALGSAPCVPVVLKDNIETEQVRTTFGSSLFADWVPDADAPVVARLRAQGAIVLAKGNLDDFAAAVYGVSEIDGAAKNPYDPTRTVGGSSGGPAASVAAGYAPLGIGTDTGGSLRIPAAFNSVVTIRPTVGLVSRTGMSPRALTQDTAGPMARTVADAAAGLDLIAGADPTDPSTSRAGRHIPAAGYAASATGGSLTGVRIGVIREGIPLWGGVQQDVAGLQERAIDDLEALGATVIDLPQAFVDKLDRGFSCGNCLLDSGVIGFESRRDLTAFLGSLSPAPPVSSFDELYAGGAAAGRYSVHAKESFDREAGVDLTNSTTATDYQTALDRQSQLRGATLAMLAEHDLDAVIYPSATWFPDPLGEEQSGVFTRWSEQTGFPSLGMPIGFGMSEDNPGDKPLPASLEFLGAPFDEQTLIRIASAYERASGRRVAPASTPATSVELADVPVTPPATTQPAPAPAPRAVIAGLRLDRQLLRTARSRGVQVYLRCQAACVVTVELRIARSTARRLKLRSVVVGRASFTLGTSGRTVRVRFSRTALARLPRRGVLGITAVAAVRGSAARDRVIVANRLR